MRIATCTRISTDEDRQPFSLGAQAERLEAYARSQDSWRIVRPFTDQASGATPRPPCTQTGNVGCGLPGTHRASARQHRGSGGRGAGGS